MLKRIHFFLFKKLSKANALNFTWRHHRWLSSRLFGLSQISLHFVSLTNKIFCSAQISQLGRINLKFKAIKNETVFVSFPLKSKHLIWERISWLRICWLWPWQELSFKLPVCHDNNTRETFQYLRPPCTN